MRKLGKKMASGFLAVALLGSTLFTVAPAKAATVTPGTPYKSSGSYDVTVPHVFINQVYGADFADANDAAVSHSFIELYNPTNNDLNLTGWSLQAAKCMTEAVNCTAGSWDKLDLTQTIKAHSSYLVVVNATNTTKLKKTIVPSDADQSWTLDNNGQPMKLKGKGLKVALMSNTAALTAANPFSSKPAGFVDMVGAGTNDVPSSIDAWEGTIPAAGFSKKKSLRRIYLNDTDNNDADFEQVEYSTQSSPKDPHYGKDGVWTSPLGIKTARLGDGFVNQPYSASVSASVYGGQAPFTYQASGLPTGVTMSVYGAFSGTPAASGDYNVVMTVTDSAYASVTQNLKLKVYDAPAPNAFEVTKIGSYSVGTVNKDGGVAEIVKYNKENGRFYLVNGFTKKLDIVKLDVNTTMTTEKSIDVKTLSETEGFVYGDLTSVDVNTSIDTISMAIQELDAAKNGKILVLDYNGTLLKSYETGVQPDMIKTTKDGRYILTANEAEKRDAAVDPEGGVTVVDTTTGVVKHVKFDNPAIIADDVHVRGTSSNESPLITGSGTKADAIFDFEPEYIALSEDQSLAYVSIQEDNAVATLDITSGTFTSVKSLGYKDLSDPRNALDLIKDGMVKLENVPFKGMYMPDGIASFTTVTGATYLFTANEGDVTDWTGRKNGTTVSAEKAKLQKNTPAEIFLRSNSEYIDVEVASDMPKDSLYLSGGRSFSVWDASTMSQVYDSGSDFEKITAYKLLANFNASNDDVAKDKRSPKKGPEPEDIKVAKVGDKAFAFIGLERTGGVMTYDVTNPTQPVFANYTNSRDFTITDFQTDTGPEGIEFIPAPQSPTNLPLLLVANEVGGRVAVLQLNVTKVVLDKTSYTTRLGDAPVTLTATITPTPVTGQTAWTSSNPSIATVDSNGKVTAVAVGKAVITATSPDGYGIAESEVTVENAVSSGGGNTGTGTGSSATPPATITPSGDGKSVSVSLTPTVDANGTAKASLTDAQVTEMLKSATTANAPDGATIEIKLTVDPKAKEAVITLPDSAFAALANGNVKEIIIDAGFGAITLDHTSIAAISNASSTGEVAITVTKADNGTIKISQDDKQTFDQVIQNRPVLDFHVTTGGTTVSSFNGGTVTVSVPYKSGTNENTAFIVTYYISDSGELTVLPNSQYDAATGTLRFGVKHFSKYAVGYNPVSFSDTNGSFAKTQIEYLAARDIIQGIDIGKFAPESSITRADFTLILARLAGADLNIAGTPMFKDVKADSYYAQAVKWAVQAGITNGVTADEFAPTANVTREQMVTMIVRLAQSMKYALPTSTPAASFADQESIPAFAKDAAKAVQQAGIVSGKSYSDRTGSFFAPKDAASREEAAKMLGILLQGMNQ